MRKKSTMLLALVMAAVMLFSLAGCKDDGGKKPSSSSTAADSQGNVPSGEGYVDDGKQYTYRMAPSDIPESWNYHTYQSNSSTYVLDYTSDGLYTFAYNDDFTGYKIVPGMAADYPVDVTADYVGKYGIVAGEENKAYKITLKDYLFFDNGEKLDANSFVESMKLLLDPAAANFRADNVYQAGQLKIYNAENYVKQNSYALSNFLGAYDYMDPSTFKANSEGILQHEGYDLVVDINNGADWGASIIEAAGSQVFSEDGTQIALVNETTGERWGWRTVNRVGEGDDAHFVFYDLNGNEITGVTVNAAGTGYEYQGTPINFEYSYPAPAQALIDAADEDGQVKLTAEHLKNLQNLIAILHGYASVEEYAKDEPEYAYQECLEMIFLGKFIDKMEYDGNVGFFAPSANELVIVLKNPMEDNFYLRYELCSSFFLVYAPLYKECIKIDNGVYTNTYGTSVDTFVGYGPYKLTQYTEGATIRLDRNTHWRGYNKNDYIAGTYMTDSVSYQKVTEDAVRLGMFLKGEIDSYGLTVEDMKDYNGSQYTYYNDSESTWYLAMNPDLENLGKIQNTTNPVNAGNAVIKTVLTIPEFRQALSYSLDRNQFNQTLSPTSGVAKALLSSMIVADPESGLTYRAMDEAKDAILEFWGLSDKWGEGKEYADRDEAIDSITGYDPAGAKTLFDKAYDLAVSQGLITQEQISSGKWEVQLTIGKPAEGNYYNQGYEFLKSNWEGAVKGTKFEGHLTFVQSAVFGATTFGKALRTGTVDILFGVGYGGSMFDPYSMMDCFTGSLQYDPFTDKSKIDLDVTIDGKTLRASLYDWVSVALQGDKIEAVVVDANGNATSEKVTLSAGASDKAETRVAILAAAETKVLTLANIFPVSTDATASLRCMRVQYKTEDYVVGMGRGGIEWYTYAMDDAQFAEYVKNQGGTLNYK